MCAAWIKLNLDMLDNVKLKIINSMPERDTINYIWISLLIMAGKVNDGGKIYVNKKITYTVETLSIILERPQALVKLALDTMCALGMITIDNKNIIKIKNWAKYQNVEGLEKAREQSKLRMRKKRERDRENKEKLKEGNELRNSDVTVTEKKQNVTPKNKRENREEEKDEDVNKKERRKSNVVSLEERKMEEVNEVAVRILNHYESLTGKPGIFKFESIVLAISKHGADNVKMAIDKSIEAGKITMRYVNGILRNWAKEGYPKEGGPMDGDSGLASDGGKFKGIEPQKPRELTEEERKNSKELI